MDYRALATIMAPLVTAAVQQYVKGATSIRPDVQVHTGDITDALERHLKHAEEWCSSVKFADMAKPKSLADVFVDLELNVTPRRLRLDGERSRLIRVSVLANSTANVVILGDPGAGKTTSLKRLCTLMLRSAKERGFGSLVIVIILRDLGTGESLATRTLLEMGVGLTFAASVAPGARSELARQILLDTISQLPLTMYIDGLDEIREELREGVEADLDQILQRSRKTRIVLTTRSADYRNNLPNCSVYELEPLSPDQVVQFATRWLVEQALVDDFLSELRKSPFADTAVRPLTLSHLCAIYSRTLRIPEKPKTVYRKIINLLLREWDEQKSVRRTTVYSNFEADRKQEFLEHLAFYLARAFQVSRFSHEQLRAAYTAIAQNHQLPLGESAAVAREVESHTGVIVQSSYERYEFAHKSLQEYLAAEFIVKYPALPEGPGIFRLMPNELAVAVALSSMPSRYLAELLLTGVILEIDDPGNTRANPISNRVLYEGSRERAMDQNSASRVFSSVFDLKSRILLQRRNWQLASYIL